MSERITPTFRRGGKLVNLLLSFGWFTSIVSVTFILLQRLSGATLLVFANKQDLPGALSFEEIRDVSDSILYQSSVILSF